MKRVHIELQQIAQRDNLTLALWRAAKGKRQRAVVKQFLACSEQNLYRLGKLILDGTAPYGDYRQFTIYDPKKRTIHAACFSDRIVHHAVMNLAGPVLQRALCDNTYACIQRRGVHAAALRVQHCLRRYPWYVQIDIAGYFAAIDHQILYRLLAGTFKGNPFLDLLSGLIAANGQSVKHGLPIGSLTSQYFANYYLDGADRFIGEQLPCPMVRYMDDIIWWCHSREQARNTLAQVTHWLEDNRHLQLHDNPLINRSRNGAGYCGYRIRPDKLRLSARRKKRYVTGRTTIEADWQCGVIGDIELQQRYDALRAITLPADSIGFRRDNLRRHAPVQL